MSDQVVTGIPLGIRGRSQGRTITEAEMTLLASVTGATGEIHTNREFARDKGFADLTVGGAILVAFGIGMWRTSPLFRSLRSDYGVVTITGLGWEVRLRAPVYGGDTVWLESELVRARPSRSNPAHAIVHFDDRMVNQDGAVVVELERAVLVRHAQAGERSGGADSGT